MSQKRLRRTMLFVPGNNPGMVQDAHIYGSDSIIFDLEDSVSINQKDAARELVYQALKSVDYDDKEIVIRINGLDTPYWRYDIEAMVSGGAHVIRIPKVQHKQDILDVESVVAEAEEKAGREKDSVKLMAAIESALGVINAYSIAVSSKRLIGIALGAEDFIADLQTNRSPEGTELFFARSMILTAARAAGIDAIDTVFSNVNDMEGFEKEVRFIKQLGFDGKSVINPRQIAVVHDIFTPSVKEVDEAKLILDAIAKAESRGSGVLSLQGRMIDKPIVERARRVITCWFGLPGRREV